MTVIRNSAGLIIEDVEFEAVATDYMGCGGCGFTDRIGSDDCFEHACQPDEFPADHPLHGKRIRWVRKTT